ncbi:MAG: class I adenylate cyclase [Desulfovibrionaceae bacterium]
MSTASPLFAVLHQLREYHRTRRDSGMAGAEPLVQHAFSFLDQEPDRVAASRHASELACMLAAFAFDTQDAALVKRCLVKLLGLGDFGVMLAATVLHKSNLSADAVRGMVGGFSGHEKLAVCNRFFAAPRDCEPALMQWAYETVAAIQNDDPEEVLLFLEGLGQGSGEPSGGHGQALALPLQNEFMGSRFGIWLHQLLKLDLDVDQAVYMARTTAHLESDGLAMALARHLKTANAGGHGETVALLLRTMGRCAAKGNAHLAKAIASFLKHRDESIKQEALEALLAMHADGAVASLASLYAERPSMRPACHGLLFGLSGSDFLALCKGLDSAARQEALAYLVRVLAACDADRLMALLDNLAAANGDAAGIEAVKSFVLGQEKMAPAPLFKPAPPARRKAQAAEGASAGGLFAKMTSKMLGGEQEEDAGPAPAARELAALSPGSAVRGATFAHAEAEGLQLSGVTFSGAAFADLCLTEGAWTKVAFDKCRFRNVNFWGTRFAQVRFTDCEFTFCSFADTVMQACAFAGGAVAATSFAAAVLQKVTFSGVACRENTFWGARWEESAATACRFAHTDFAYGAWVGVAMHASVFEDCRFVGVYARNAALRGVSATGCVMHGCLFHDLDTDAALFMAEEEQSRARVCADMGRRLAEAPPPASLATPEAHKTLLRLAERWYFEKDALRRGRLFMANNERRLAWTARKLAGQGAAFLTMLPACIEAGAAWNGKGFDPAVPCLITGYAPGLAARALVARHLGELAAPGQGEPPIPLEGLYSIGSVGSVAQTRSSDLDIWVCYDAAGAGGREAALRGKLAALERWADKVFGLEVHFFLMDMVRTRENDFGFSDAESAGSTQAKLLKEEFYRTALLLAGRTPAWWFTPGRGGERDYAMALARMRASPPLRRLAPLDLGHLERIPREEFFGASLWQIVKALKSPFKSVMKFALLDKYYAGNVTPILVCDRIKDKLEAGARGLWDTDPYAVLFQEVYEYYQGVRAGDAQQLMRRAFIQKTGCTTAMRTTGRPWELRGSSWMEFFFPYSEAAIAGEFMPADRRAKGSDDADDVLVTFSDMISLGDMVGQFMFRTYQNVQNSMNKLDMEVMVTVEDLTKVGGKMFSCLKPKKDKIMRISFVDSPKDMFSALDFTCEGLQGAAMTWIARGENAVRQGKRAAVEELRRDTSPVRLCIWLVANGVYRPGMHVAGGNLQAPVSVPDMVELLDALAGHFPSKRVFDTDIGENLKREEVVRACLVPNFTVMREDQRLRELTLIYATNWGELFCKPGIKDAALLAKPPRACIQAVSRLDVREDMELLVHYPRKSLCPKLDPAKDG